MIKARQISLYQEILKKIMIEARQISLYQEILKKFTESKILISKIQRDFHKKDSVMSLVFLIIIILNLNYQECKKEKTRYISFLNS